MRGTGYMRKKIIIILLAIVFAVLTLDRMPQILFIIGLSAIFIYFVKKTMEKDKQALVISLFLATFLIQIFISLILYNHTVDTKFYGFSYKGDDYVYGDFGTIIGKMWREGIFPKGRAIRYYNLIGKNVAIQEYQIYNAVMFFLFGIRAGQMLLIINCFFHSAILIPLYFIGKELKLKKNVIIFMFSLFLFWPSVFYWSLFNFKEPIMLFLMLAVFASFMKFTEKRSLPLFAFIIVGTILIYFLKELVAIALALAMVGYMVFTYKWKWRDAIILWMLTLFFMFHQITGKPVFANLYVIISSMPLTIQGIRHSTIFSNTSYMAGFYIYTYPRLIMLLPLGALMTVFYPFFTRPMSIAHIASNIELILWCGLIPFWINGIWIAATKERKKMLSVLSVFFLWFLFLTLTQSNMGTLIRQKVVFYYTSFIFAALSINNIVLKKRSER